jgi:serine/threonine protein kinase
VTGLFRGDKLGRYRVERVLGEGAMGVVYYCVQEGEPHEVALKVLRPELSESPTYRQRFDHELRVAREVSHRSLVPIVDAGQAEGYHYLAMPYIGEQTLKDRIGVGALSVRDTIRVAAALGGALDALHGNGLMHRDVKPSNVLLTDDGTPLLSDFGIAKGVGYTVLTRTGQLVGTLDYLAPEMIRGERASVASDVYAMGCVLYECLVGEPPFGQRPLFQVGFAHLSEEPVSPARRRTDVSEELGKAVLLALHKSADGRPKSAGELATLVRIVGREPTPSARRSGS